MNCKYKVKIKRIQYNYRVQMAQLQGKYKFNIFCTGGNKELEEKVNTLYEAWPRVSGTGETITLNNTVAGKMLIDLKGNTSQEGTPTPESPQDIHVVSGDNSIVVCGKNLAPTDWASDFVSRVNDSSKASLVIEDNRHCVFFLRNAGYGEYDTKYFFKTNWKENTQYTVSFYIKPTATQSNLSFLYTDGTNKTLADKLTANVWQKLTVTSLANKTLERIQGYWALGEDYVDIDTFMVYEGTETLPYEPYTGESYPITLPEGTFLGWIPNTTYQDEIFKNTPNTTDYDSNLEDNVWYLKKEIGKIESYNGETITTSYISTTGGLDTGATVYYVLATPTDTQITDSTLLSQLEAIKEAESYSGQTNISQTNDDKPFILTAKALKDLSNL